MAAKMAAKMKKTLTFSLQYAQLPVDIQLDHISCIVQWSDSYCWKLLVLLPGMMHTLTSFIGCIWKLMKASCVNMLLIVSFGESLASSQVSGLMHYVHVISLRQYCSRISSKTYQELREHKEAVREHPCEKLWVDCLIKPSLLALRLLHAHRDGDFLLQTSSFITIFKEDFFPLP